MSLSFPLALPSSPPGLRTFQMLGRSTIGVAKSPFTGSPQAYEFPGEWWEAQFSLPPMARADAERWISFLLALRGRGGTFLLGDPIGKSPQSTAGGSPIVSGAGQKGKQLTISGLTGVLKAGDYFHIGSAGENLLLWSQTFTHAPWNLNNNLSSNPVVTDNAIVAPDGTTTAATVAYPNTAGISVYSDFRTDNIPVAYAGTGFTCSLWLKLASGTGSLFLYLIDGTGVGISGSPATFSLTSSWQRFSFAGTFPSTVPAGGPGIVLRANNQAAITAHIWGAQLERGLVLNNYIPTTTAQAVATRQLLKNLTDQGPGSVTLDIFPKLRLSPLNAEPLIITNPVGLFRLATNDQANWTVDVAKRYGIGVSAVEAL